MWRPGSMVGDFDSLPTPIGTTNALKGGYPSKRKSSKEAYTRWGPKNKQLEIEETT